MNKDVVLTNANIVTLDEVFKGTVKISDGKIDSIDRGTTLIDSSIDLEGDYLIPGLIDIHTDNLEKHVEPRPGVHWPFAAALSTHDHQLFSAGITTVLDALTVGDYYDQDAKSGRKGTLEQAIIMLEEAQESGLLRTDHHLHIRCEISTENVLESFEPFADDPLVRMVSVMDHTPGQRQWANMEKWRTFNRKRFGNDDAAAEAFYIHRCEMQAKYSDKHRKAVIEACKHRNLPLASHDDTTIEHIHEACAVGIEVSEFPTTIEAAQEAHAQDMMNVMGAPNVVLGGSHSGNVSALELAKAGLLDGLASDYVPISLLHGAFQLWEQTDMELPAAIATVTANPADMVDLTDRGEIAIGKRADLVWVRQWHHMPMIRGIWRAGVKMA